jgi:hypothetical protein
MKWVQAVRFIDRKVPYKIRFNWLAIWNRKPPGGGPLQVSEVKGYGYTCLAHARYTLFKYLTDGFKSQFKLQTLKDASEHPNSTWVRLDREGWTDRIIRGKKKPVLEDGDEGYDGPIVEPGEEKDPMEFGWGVLVDDDEDFDEP